MARPNRFELARKRKDLRERAVQFLGGCCQICGYDRCLLALEFHHPEVWRKDFTISAKLTSWQMIEPELKKTILLCCRCHREVHDGLHPSYVEHEASNLGGWDED